MRHHRNTGPHQCINGVEHVRTAALHLYRGDASFLNRASAVQHCTLDAGLIREKGHVDDHKRPLYAPPHSRRMIDHMIQRDRECRRISHNCSSHRIADKNCIDSRLVDESSKERIVGRHHHDLLTLSLVLGEITNGRGPLYRPGFIQRASS